MKKILVTGSSGQLGSELRVLSINYSEYEWIFADRTLITLDDLSVLEEQLSNIKPDYILNCAAYTAVDKAESEQDAAITINHLAVGIIAHYVKKNEIRFIHISTDYVFDGCKAEALTEEENTSPINVYGATKLAGEKATLDNDPTAIIIRTSWVYSSFGNNFVKTMSRLMQERESLNVVNDQIGSPTYAADLAQVMITILKNPVWEPGIYNYSNEGEISWFEFALAIKEIGGFDCQVNGIPTLNYPTPAKRPAFSLLNKNKIKATFGVVIPHYKDSLRKCMFLLKEN